MIADRVGIAHQIKPERREAFAERGMGQQAIDENSPGGIVGKGRVDGHPDGGGG
jgi:hypothetical protein